MNSVLILVYTMSLLVVTGKGSNPLASIWDGGQVRKGTCLINRKCVSSILTRPTL